MPHTQQTRTSVAHMAHIRTAATGSEGSWMRKMRSHFFFSHNLKAYSPGFEASSGMAYGGLAHLLFGWMDWGGFSVSARGRTRPESASSHSHACLPAFMSMTVVPNLPTLTSFRLIVSVPWTPASRNLGTVFMRKTISTGSEALVAWPVPAAGWRLERHGGGIVGARGGASRGRRG